MEKVVKLVGGMLENYTAMVIADSNFYILKSDKKQRPNSAFDNLNYQVDVSDSAKKETSTSDVHAQLQHTESSYGWGRVGSQRLQHFNKPAYFLAVLCMCVMVQSLVTTGITNAVISSIEKQFGYTSAISGTIFVSSYDIAYGTCCIFVGYIGQRHKPRFLGFGVLLMAIAAFVITIPKYLIGKYSAGEELLTDFCQGNSTAITHNCDQSSDKWFHEALFVFGTVLFGIGATPLFTLAPAHIDEITTRSQGSLYMGIYYASASLGLAVGFILGLPILNTWVDITQPANSNLTPEDRNWVGAWWIGYLIGAVMLLIPAIPMLGFPRVFPNFDNLRKQKSQLEDTIEEDKELKHDTKSIWPSIKKLLTNLPFLFITLAISAESLAVGGFATFLPKFVETQFHFTSSTSSIYTGMIVIPGATGGIFLGGYLSKRFSWNCRDTMKSSTIIAFISMLCVTAVLVGCDGRDIVGGTIPYHDNSTISLDSSCNLNCHCSTEFYKPVCSVDEQKTYFSPCHAGCFKEHHVAETFYNCACLPASKVINGRCTPECDWFPLFVVMAFLMMFTTFLNNVPMLNATLRVVPMGLGSFAMGFQQVFVRFLGFIPAPSIFGRLIDDSCKFWGRDKCTNEETSCLEYHNKEFRYYMFLLGLIFKFLSFLFIFLALKFYRAPVKIEKSVNETALQDVATFDVPEQSLTV